MVDLKLNLIQTLSVAAAVYFVGIQVRKRVPVLDRLNIPSAVIGGLIFAILVVITRDRWINFQFDTSTQLLFQVAFFTTIGMGASLSLLRIGGLQVGIFLAISVAFCFIQNFLGVGLARLLDVNPLLGVMAGSVTLIGGPATGMAFAPEFEARGLVGAQTAALAAATFGIVCGGITGGPIGTWLINRFQLKPAVLPSPKSTVEFPEDAQVLAVNPEDEESSLIRNGITLAVAMGLGTIVSNYLAAIKFTLPAYIGAMVVASVLRNLDDRTKLFKVDERAMALIGTVTLNIFLVVALMDLKLWQLLGLVIPMLIILTAQVLVVCLFAAIASYWVMGADYDSAVMSSGFIGFALGTTANAMANMRTLVGKFGAAPRAFIVVPIVGAFFIDFANGLIIPIFLNWF